MLLFPGPAGVGGVVVACCDGPDDFSGLVASGVGCGKLARGGKEGVLDCSCTR